MICCFKGKFRVTSPRGDRVLNGVKAFHKGIDIVGIDDTTVYSICDGTVRTAYEANGAGYYIVVICEFTGIPNKIGTYEYKAEIASYEAACRIEDKAGLEKQTMSYRWKYKYANELMIKLWKAME